MRTSAPALLCLAFLAAAGCRRGRGDSPQFEQAFRRYTQLYADKLDDAYGDPAMAQVLALLRQVDPRSSRAAEAAELESKVEKGMKEFADREARLAAADKAAAAAPAWPAAREGPAPVAAPPVAAAGPALGMTRDEFLGKFGGCFVEKGLYEQGAKHGEAYAMKLACAARYPFLQGDLVVLLDGRVSRLVPLSDVTVSTREKPAATPPAPPPPAKPPPPPPPAPRTVHWMPGGPRPTAP